MPAQMCKSMEVSPQSESHCQSYFGMNQIEEIEDQEANSEEGSDVEDAQNFP